MWTNRVWNRRLRPLYPGGPQAAAGDRRVDRRGVRRDAGRAGVRPPADARRPDSSGESHLLARKELFAWWRTRAVEILWELILPAASGALMLYGGLAVLHGRLSLGDLMMFLVYLAMLLEPLAVLATSVTQLQNNLAGFDRVLDILAEPREMADDSGHRRSMKHSVVGRITLDGVSFMYPSTDADGPARHRSGRRAGRDDRPGGPERRGQDDALQPGRPVLRPDLGLIRLDGVDLRKIRGRQLPPASRDRRAGRVPVRRHGRRKHRLRRPCALEG